MSTRTLSCSETALLLALLFKRANLRRARVSSATIRKLSGRTMLRAPFVADLRSALDELGLVLVEVDRGGYALIPWQALNGSPPITAKKYLSDVVGSGDIDFDHVKQELGYGDSEEEDDNDALEDQ